MNSFFCEGKGLTSQLILGWDLMRYDVRIQNNPLKLF